MGDKVSARNLMAGQGVPVAPGTREPVTDVDAALAAASRFGWPVMVKASAGGGGIGMSVATDGRACAPRSTPPAPARSDSSATRRSCWSGTCPGAATSRYSSRARRRPGRRPRRARLLRAASPSKGGGGDAVPGGVESLRATMLAAAVRAGEAVGYRGAGTVEFLLDPRTATSSSSR